MFKLHLIFLQYDFYNYIKQCLETLTLCSKMIKFRRLVINVKLLNVSKILFAVIFLYVTFTVITAYFELQKKLAASQEIIQRTRGFAEQNVDEEDLELVEFVKTLLVAPSPVHIRNLSDKSKTDFSQIGKIFLYFQGHCFWGSGWRSKRRKRTNCERFTKK